MEQLQTRPACAHGLGVPRFLSLQAQPGLSQEKVG